MFKKIMLIACIFSSHIYTSEQNPTNESLIKLEDIPWVDSYEPSEVNNDSFAISVISYIDTTDTEMPEIKD